MSESYRSANALPPLLFSFISTVPALFPRAKYVIESVAALRLYTFTYDTNLLASHSHRAYRPVPLLLRCEEFALQL